MYLSCAVRSRMKEQSKHHFESPRTQSSVYFITFTKQNYYYYYAAWHTSYSQLSIIFILSKVFTKNSMLGRDDFQIKISGYLFKLHFAIYTDATYTSNKMCITQVPRYRLFTNKCDPINL